VSDESDGWCLGSDPSDSTLVRLTDRYQSVTDTIVQLFTSRIVVEIACVDRVDSGQGGVRWRLKSSECMKTLAARMGRAYLSTGCGRGAFPKRGRGSIFGSRTLRQAPSFANGSAMIRGSGPSFKPATVRSWNRRPIYLMFWKEGSQGAHYAALWSERWSPQRSCRPAVAASAEM